MSDNSKVSSDIHEINQTLKKLSEGITQLVTFQAKTEEREEQRREAEARLWKTVEDCEQRITNIEMARAEEKQGREVWAKQWPWFKVAFAIMSVLNTAIAGAVIKLLFFGGA